MPNVNDIDLSFHKTIAFGVGERRRLIFACLSLLFLLLIATWLFAESSQQKLIEFKSRQVANVIAVQAKTARSIYSRTVVAKLAREGFSASTDSDNHVGSVPIPAQFLKALSHDSALDDKKEYQLRALSKWNISPEQGLKDDFQKWAWAQLESQQAQKKAGNEVAWEPVWRVDMFNGKEALRYLVADPAASQSCVDCHNSLESTPAIVALRKSTGVQAGKQWELHDLMGALEVIVPVHESSSMAAAQTRAGVLLVLVVAIIGILFVLGISALDGVRSLAISKKFEHQARNDELTGLPNRSGFEYRTNSLLDNDKTPISNAVLLLDLNDFKRINDTLGHHIGDDVLKETAKRLQNVIDESAVIGRLGGDEFVVYLPDVDDADIHAIVQSIITALDKNIELEGFRMNARASVGIARMPADGNTLHELLRSADVAMYCAKRAKTGYEFYDIDKDDNNIGSLSLINDLKSAIETGGLALVYQPKFDLTQGTVCSVEALLRWHHPEHGMISPTRIIPMAEQSGQITALTRWTVAASLAQLKQWQAKGHDFKMAINLSARMLDCGSTVDMLLGLLNEYEISSDRLIVEVTETAVMTDIVKAAQLLNRLSRAGVILSLDDFGTGYSSLAYIHRLPIQELKLDRSFMEKLHRPKNKAIVKTAIALAENLELDLIAEGVEDAATLAMLLDLNCSKVQGYFLCKPASADMLTVQFNDLYALARDWQAKHHAWLKVKAA